MHPPSIHQTPYGRSQCSVGMATNTRASHTISQHMLETTTKLPRQHTTTGPMAGAPGATQSATVVLPGAAPGADTGAGDGALGCPRITTATRDLLGPDLR